MALFPRPQTPQNPLGNIFAQAQAIRQAMGGNPQAFAIQFMRSNPEIAKQFNDFMTEHQGQTPAEVLRESGIDPSSIGM